MRDLILSSLVLFASAAVALDLETFAKLKPEIITKRDIAENAEVSADKMSADNETGTVALNGNVHVRFSDVVMTADSAHYNRETGHIQAHGNIKISSETSGSWEGESIVFNHKTGEGLFGTGVLKSGGFTVVSDSYERDDNEVFHANRTWITTCTNDHEHAHWSMTGSAKYKDNEFIEIENVVLRFMDFPVFWFPYYYRDLNTSRGFRFMPGYTSKWGAYLTTGYVYPISGNGDTGNVFYGKTTFDLRQKRGVGLGQEFTWKTNKFNQWGRLLGTYAYDTREFREESRNWGSSYDKHRYGLQLTENLEFSPRDSLKIRAEYVSDSHFREDFLETNLRTHSQPVGLLNYEHRENAWGAGFALSGPLNSFYAGVRKLPEVYFTILPQTFPGMKNLYYESVTTIGYYDRQPSKFDKADDEYKYQPGVWADMSAFRADTRQMWRRPFAVRDGVMFTPRAGFRATYYSDSFDSEKKYEEPDKKVSLFRAYFELGAEFRARFVKDFEKYRHTVTPYVDWTFVPAVMNESDSTTGNFAFDRTDRYYGWQDRFGQDGFAPADKYNGVRIGMRHLLQEKTEKQMRHLLDFDAYLTYVADANDHYVRWMHRQEIDEDFEGIRQKSQTGLRVLGFNGNYTPTKRFSLGATMEFDPENDFDLAYSDIHAKYLLQDWTIYAGLLVRNHELFDYYWTDHVKDSIVYGGFIHRLTDVWSWSLFARWNLEQSELEETGGFLQYSLDCISFRLNLGYVSAYTSEDGYKSDADFRISLGVWLRAFPNKEVLEWQTWGNIAAQDELTLENLNK